MQQCEMVKAHQEEGDNDRRQNADSRNEVGIHAQLCGICVLAHKTCPAESMPHVFILTCFHAPVCHC